jgi:putative Mg2+ transporter-C (MgtC) family protein
MFELTGYETEFIAGIVLSLVSGILIGSERELRNKPAGISTHSFVIGGAFIFTYLSTVIDPSSPARIAAQIVTGVGFLGAGIILKSEDIGSVKNLTTAASIWYSAAIGMAIGFEWHIIAMIATLYAIFVPRIPHIGKLKDRD